MTRLLWGVDDIRRRLLVVEGGGVEDRLAFRLPARIALKTREMWHFECDVKKRDGMSVRIKTRQLWMSATEQLSDHFALGPYLC